VRRADRSSRGILPSVMCMRVMMKPLMWAMTRNRVEAPRWVGGGEKVSQKQQRLFPCIKLTGFLSERDCVYCAVRAESLLGAFAILRKATVIFVMSVPLSAWNNSAPTERIFMQFDI
jgi:hypothetical protein